MFHNQEKKSFNNENYNENYNENEHNEQKTSNVYSTEIDYQTVYSNDLNSTKPSFINNYNTVYSNDELSSNNIEDKNFNNLNVANLNTNQPPPDYSKTDTNRKDDYVINTPYTFYVTTEKVKSKNMFIRFLGHFFSIAMFMFLIILSFVLFRSFQASLTASYITRLHLNQWQNP